MFQFRTISPVRTAVADTAGGWREGGRSRSPAANEEGAGRGGQSQRASSRERLGFCSFLFYRRKLEYYFLSLLSKK